MVHNYYHQRKECQNGKSYLVALNDTFNSLTKLKVFIYNHDLLFMRIVLNYSAKQWNDFDFYLLTLTVHFVSL